MLLTKPAALPAREDLASPALHLLSCVRISEVLVLQGTPLLGLFFALGFGPAHWVPVALLTAGSTFLTAHVFVLNDWSGMSGDLRDPNRRNGVFTRRGVGREAIAFFSLALLVAGLLLLSDFGLPTVAIALGIAGLSALYSFPRVHLKGVPVPEFSTSFCGRIAALPAGLFGVRYTRLERHSDRLLLRVGFCGWSSDSRDS